ncbi:MAG TPA: TonB-dependent receptor [Lacibacter sp.]|nr:TonB-dependent receptor [Lacibacter sp.]HMO87678.1 TonB-dependent receptor [Lacibacter sp.]
MFQLAFIFDQPMKKSFLLLVAVLSVLFTYAQPAGLSGKVTDSTGEKGMTGATVKLVEKATPADTLRTITNSKGEFSFSRIPASGYQLIVSYAGYNPLVKEYFRPSPGVTSIDIGELVLSNAFKLLTEIVVEAPAVSIKEDTVEYRASAFQVKPNATTEDLLKKLPGVQVDRDGNITAQGKQVTRIKVNGKDFFTGDPKSATRELPADMIDKVQVVDDYGDQSAISGIRDGEPEKVINLQLRKDKNKGWFGRGQAGVGTSDRYQAGVTLNYFNNNNQLSIIGNSNNVNQSNFNLGEMSGFGGGNFGGGTINFGGGGGGFGGGGGGRGGGGMGAAFGNLLGGNQGQNQNGISRTHSIGTNFRSDFGKRNSFYGSYTYTNRNTRQDQFTSQQSLIADPPFTNVTNQLTNNTQGTHRAFLNLELWVDSFNYIKITPNISVQQSNNLLSNSFDIFRSASLKAQQGVNQDTTLSTRPSFRTGILYNHRFRKRGRNFSLNTDIGYNETDLEQLRANNTQFFQPDGSNGFLLNQLQRINQDNRNNSINLRAVYTEPLSAERFLDFSYNFNRNVAVNDRSTDQKDLVSGQFNRIDSLSNAFENNFNFNRFGASIRTVKKKYNYTLGIQLQPVSLRGYSITKDSTYQPIRNLNWFPVARMTYNLSRTKSFNFQYNGSAQQPSFEQLQPVRDVTNPQNQREGNPFLRPSINHTLSTNYNNFNFASGQVLFTGVTLTLARDQIVNNTINIKGPGGLPTGAQLSRPENVNGFYNVTGFYTFSKPWKNRKYVLTLLGTLNYNNNINLVDAERNIGRNWLVVQGLNFDYNAKQWLELSFGARYNMNQASFSLQNVAPQTQETWVLSNDIRVDLPGSWILRWHFDFTLNLGLAQGVSRNIALFNGSLEKELFKKKNGTIRLEAFDLFNQNINVNRSVSANFITDTRINRLTQYFMLTFQYRLNKFRGQQPQQQNNFRRMGGRMLLNNGD